MKHVILSYCICLLLINFTSSFAQKVSEKDLNIAIENVQQINSISKKVKKLSALSIEKDTTIYIVEFEEGGFVILSADYSAPTLLGICNIGNYNTDIMPGGLLYLMDTYSKSIKSLRDNKIIADPKTVELWKCGLSTCDVDTRKSVSFGQKDTDYSSLSSVSNLLSTTWGQGSVTSQSYSYNKYCPTGCYAGCVAVAMAQVLFKWKWDVNQTGSNTFDGQTVNFGAVDYYCWNSMPTNSSNNFNAYLIYHAGVSCNTDYCNPGSSSGANLSNARNGFVNFWGMSSEAELKQRYWINIPISWKNRLKDDLNNQMPIVYAGGAHSWVISGYSGDNFWCNWGWDGLYDGYYSLGGFNVPGNDFNDNEWAIFKVHPATTVINNFVGPDNLTSVPARYDIVNIADCVNASWSYTPNIQIVNGGQYWCAAKAIGSGIGWIDATYVLDGVIHNAPRKYIVCLP